jgi:hypothetical protein
MENTMEINTLVLAPTEFDVELSQDHMVPYNALSALKFLVQAHMVSFLETNDFAHYVAASRIKRQIREMCR